MTPTPPATTAPPAQTGACTAAYKLVGEWQGGFQAEVTVTAGAGALTGWRVGWTFADGQTIVQVWGGRSTPTGATQNVVNESWNGGLAAGASTTFGFVASRTSVNNAPSVTCAAV